MSYTAECPYCEKYVPISNDDGFGSDEDVTYEQTCNHCEKQFTFTVSWSPYYSTEKAPHLNHEEKAAL